jgi:heme exporter protein C
VTATADPAEATGGGTDHGPTGTGSRGTRVLGGLTVLGTVVVVVMGLFVSKPDTELGETVRLMYVHVPSATSAYMGCFLVTLGSAVYLWKRSGWWDLVAQASAPIATVFTALALITGSLWGRPTWGTYWEWDARLTSTAMLFMLLLGYLALRNVPADAAVRAKRSAIVGCLLVPNVIIVNRSVEWWRSLHQKSTLVRADPEIGGTQLLTLFLAFVVFGLYFAWLLIHRFRIAHLEQQIEEMGLTEAIEARRAEGRA